MSYTSNPSTVRLHSRADASSAPRNMRGTTSRVPHILTYCYGSRMVYVAPGEDYDVCPFLPWQSHPLPSSLIDTSTQRAIDIAIESFPGLRDIDRDRIRLEIRVMHSHQRTVEIGRTAWPFLAATLARFDIVDVCVAPPPLPPRFVPAPPSSVAESTPHDSVTGWPEYYGNAQTNFVAYRAQMPPSLLQPHPHTTHVVVDVVPSRSSQGRHSPQLR